MKILKTLIVSIICFSLQGCPNDTDQDKHDMILRIKNNTNHVIYCAFDYNEILLLPIRFPEFPYHQSLNSN